jgi:RHS repeat-associated protein
MLMPCKLGVLSVLVAAALLFPSLALAREYAPAPPGGGLVENPDGTWSFYGEHDSNLRTYTSAEHEAMTRLGAGLELDTGTTGQTASEVSGIKSAETKQAEALTSSLRTGKTFVTPGEAEVGSAIVRMDEAAGTLPKKARVISAAGDLIAGPGPFNVGVKIGGGLGELYAFPPVSSNNGVFAMPDPSEDDGLIREYTKHYEYLPVVGVYRRGSESICEGFVPETEPRKAAMLDSLAERDFSVKDYCEYGGVQLEFWNTWEKRGCESTECPWEAKISERSQTSLFELISGYLPIPPCPDNWVPCYSAPESVGEESTSVYIDDGLAQLQAFPAPNVNLLKTVSEPGEEELVHQSALEAPVSATAPDVGPTKVLELILHESPELLPGIEGPGVPNPSPPHNPETWGPGNPGEPERHSCFLGKPVNCATGNQVESQTDLAVGGRGPELKLTRTYNSQMAATQKSHGPFGYGWTSSYSAHIELTDESKQAIVYQEDGSAVSYTRSEEKWVASGTLVQATLADEGSNYVYTLPNQTRLYFNSGGQLTKEEDRNGNALTMNRNEEGRLESVSDAAGRKITFSYNSEGLVESAKDPMGHAVKYTYEGGNLKSVTQPAESALRWQFKYNSSHELTSETDGRGNATTTEYNATNQVVSQTDPLLRIRKWSYTTTGSGTETTITEPNGSITVEQFNAAALLTSVTRAYGTSDATTTTNEYNKSDELIAATDPDKHRTEYGYDSSGNRTSEKNADGDERKWTYDGKHDIETETTPDSETTTIKRNSAGDPEVIERPAPGSTTQKTTYKYDADGDVESMTNPLERTWKYEYDSYGDRKAEIDPEGNKRTWEYNEDSQETATVSPRGNAAGAEASKFTTKFELNAKGQRLKITNPLSHTTKYTYDGDGNVETVIDGNAHKTKYTYDADNERTKTEEPNKTATETEYDSMGQIKSQPDGNKHVTKYVRNSLEEVEEVVNPLGKKTLKEYDATGNLIKLTDPKGRTTTYTYDPTNQLTEIVYSSGKPATVKYEYNKDGDRTKMTDGTGTTTYTYDQLDRMTESENGHKGVIKYEYNLGNQQTKITYPNTKAVERTYDKDGRLEKITDWNSKVTKFSYNADSELEKTTFPSETKDEDTYAYNDADQMTEVKMKKSSETLGSLVYTRDSDGQVKKTTSKDLPGAEVTENTYDENNRLTKTGSTEYKYDAANNPTTEGSSTNTYNEGDELEKGTGETYAYDELGERAKTTPEKGGATTYGYDQAGNLTSVERPEKESVPKIEDSYAYNGEGLRTSQTISGTTNYLAWDMTEELPLILSDGTNSYIYGPDGLPIEQISSGGTVSYLHHDQQGSTRLLTGSTGTVTGKCTYGAYGAQTCEGTATTPLGYDAQYTSSDTGLIYMRARVYDPATAQFLTVDPLAQFTRALYTYAQDNPLNRADLTGLCTGFGPAPAGCTGGPGELGPHVFCEPTKQETEQLEKERERSHFNPLEPLEKTAEWVIEKKEEVRHKLEELGSPPKCYPNEVEGGGQCSSAPPGSPGNPTYPITPDP